jgi:hypothetical protein
VARREHDRSLIAYLCTPCHQVVTAWMYRLRMIRREPRREVPGQEQEWAIAQGLIVIVLLSCPWQPQPIVDLAVVGQAFGAALRADTRRDGVEPRFTPDPIRADTQAGHELPRITGLDPDWVELLRLITRAGARLWPEQEALFASIDAGSERIVSGIGWLDGAEISCCPPTLTAIADAFERISLEPLRGGDDPGWLLDVRERFPAAGPPVFEGLLAFAEATTHEQARAALVSLFDGYARKLRLEAA